MAYILAIDPGREKNGVAVVSYQQEVICQAIIATDCLVSQLEKLLATYQIELIVVGNRTGSKALIRRLKAAGITEKIRDILTVAEDYSTEEARKRYWQAHPPTGLRRLLPCSLQTPPRPVDDYVAVILAERFLQNL